MSCGGPSSLADRGQVRLVAAQLLVTQGRHTFLLPPRVDACGLRWPIFRSSQVKIKPLPKCVRSTAAHLLWQSGVGGLVTSGLKTYSRWQVCHLLFFCARTCGARQPSFLWPSAFAQPPSLVSDKHSPPTPRGVERGGPFLLAVRGYRAFLCGLWQHLLSPA